MTKSVSLLLFFLDENRYAIPLTSVERVYPAVEITQCEADHKTEFLGFVNVHGELIPVVNARARFSLPDKAVAVSDMMVVARDGDHKLAMIVDRVADVLEYSAEQMIIAESLLYAKTHVNVINLADGMIVVQEMRDYLTETGRQWLERSKN
ncbi:chemotaxis protein CheW [bacterium]|jgi:chemotaxis signal transduction protein|nr:chemotaxis protein CheW [bacterium]MBP9811019.1 chemotaxis protein CheW [bacterium]